MSVSVVLPTRNGARWLPEVLAAVRAQDVVEPVEIVVVDSGSTDGSPDIARDHGARVESPLPGPFRHGPARNHLMALAQGDVVVFLTQDATPVDPSWLRTLLGGMALAPDVALATGPYRPRPDAPVPVARELDQWFGSFGGVRVDRGPQAGPSPATFFTSANGAVLRAAWEEVPFADVPYAEDQRLAVDMLAAGYAKAFVPDAAVVHSHAYPPLDQARRFFDEFRALREVYGHVEPLAPRPVLGRIRKEVARDRAYARAHGHGEVVGSSLRHHVLRAVGAGLGTRADRLPPAIRGWMSLEGRASYEPSFQGRS